MTGLQEILLLIVLALIILYLPRLAQRRGVQIKSVPLFRRLSGRMRLAVLGSVLWPVFVSYFWKPWQDDKFLLFLYIGIGPLVIGWGLRWVIIGFRRDKKTGSGLRP